MAQHNQHHHNRRPYQPTRSEQDLLREIARIDRMQHQLLAEEQALPSLRTQWFPARVAVRAQRFQQEVARLQQESQQRQQGAFLGNMAYVLLNMGQPRYTSYQEETFLLRSIENLRQQMLKQDEWDLSWISHREQEVVEKRMRLDADRRWLQQEYERYLQSAWMQMQRDWLLNLSQHYPNVISAPTPSPAPAQGQPHTSYIP